MVGEEVPELISRALAGKWTIVNLSNRNLQTLPPSIGRLTKLRTLDLSGNRLMALPPELGNLKHLKSLDLSQNRLAECAEVASLTDLRALDISHNRLTVLPELRRLRHLKSLNCSHNLLAALPTTIEHLADLETLEASNNQLLELPDGFGGLTNLHKVDFSANRLRTLPASLFTLPVLRVLKLDDNTLDELPSAVGDLGSLVVLSLYRSGLVRLPSSLADLSRLRHLEIGLNPLRVPPQEVLIQGTEAVLAFLDSLRLTETERFEAKLLLLGQGGVGKTSLLRNLRGMRFQTDESTTLGVDVAPVELPHPSRGDVTLKLNVWDFAGQEIEHATHQFFMSSKSVYLLLWNSRHGYVQGRLDYWLELIRSRAPEAPVMMVATHVDQRWPDINFGALQRAYPQVVGQWSIDNQSGSGITELREAIGKYAAALPLMGQPWPRTWLDVEHELKRALAHHISYSDFELVCQRNSVTNSRDRSTLAETLHNLGIILHFSDQDGLRNLVVLKPNWITKAMSYALTDGPTARAHGRLDHKALPRIWAAYDPSLYPAFFSLMSRFDLSYRLDDIDDLSLIPALLPYQPPPTPEMSTDLGIVYHLSSIPPGLMSRFIVRTHRFTQNMHWREGVILSYDGQLARAEIFEHPREFHLTVSGSSPTNFFAVLNDTVEQIFRGFPGLGVDRQIPCTCQRAKSSVRCQYMFAYEDLVRRRKKGKETIECNISLDHVSLNSLLFGIHESSHLDVRGQLLMAGGKSGEDYRQLILLGQRSIIHDYNRLESVDARAPNTFVIFSDQAKRDLTLQLACQSSDGWHLASAEASYRIIDSKDIRAMLAPLLHQTMPVLSQIVPISGLDVNLRSEVPPEMGARLRGSVRVARELVETSPVGKGGAGAIQDSLRDLYTLLGEMDSRRVYGGLRLATTPDGLRRWLCPYHHSQYQPATLPSNEQLSEAFLCHNAKDKLLIRYLASKLKTRGVSYWLDEEQLLGGDRWQDVLARGLRESACTVVCVGEYGWGDWQLEELEVALNSAAGNRSHRVIPLVIPPLDRIPDEFPIFLRNRYALVLPADDDEAVIERLVRSIQQGPRSR